MRQSSGSTVLSGDVSVLASLLPALGAPYADAMSTQANTLREMSGRYCELVGQLREFMRDMVHANSEALRTSLEASAKNIGSIIEATERSRTDVKEIVGVMAGVAAGKSYWRRASDPGKKSSDDD